MFCVRSMCGPLGAGWGQGWTGMGDATNGKCGRWGYGEHHSRAGAQWDHDTLGPGYRERCCPQTWEGSQGSGEECHRLPFGATCTEMNQCGDNLVCGYNFTCHYTLAAGEPCCNPDNGNDCHDWLCGPARAGYGQAWPPNPFTPHLNLNPTHGKCGRWDGHRDQGNLGHAYKERCCPHTDAGSTGLGEECRNLPFGATCQQLDQCEYGLTCGNNRTCHYPLPAGSPCCDADGSNCHDAVCGPFGGLDGWAGVLGNGKCGIWDSRDEANLGANYKERCCPQTLAGSDQLGEECRDIPEVVTFETTVGDETMTIHGGCKQLDQCQDGLVCDLRGNGPADSPFKTDHQCVPVMDAGSPCCDENGHECHDA